MGQAHKWQQDSKTPREVFCVRPGCKARAFLHSMLLQPHDCEGEATGGDDHPPKWAKKIGWTHYQGSNGLTICGVSMLGNNYAREHERNNSEMLCLNCVALNKYHGRCQAPLVSYWSCTCKEDHVPGSECKAGQPSTSVCGAQFEVAGRCKGAGKHLHPVRAEELNKAVKEAKKDQVNFDQVIASRDGGQWFVELKLNQETIWEGWVMDDSDSAWVAVKMAMELANEEIKKH